MMKLLLLAVVIGVALFFFKSRQRGNGTARRAPPPAAPAPPPAPVQMLACAHCGVHLPLSDACTDADGRPYCTQAHLLAGPR